MFSVADSEAVDDEISRTGPKEKNWQDLGPRQKKRTSQQAFEEIHKTAQCRGVEPVQIVGSLLHRHVP